MIEKLRKKAATLFLIFTCFIGLNYYDIGVGYITQAKEPIKKDEYVWPVPEQKEISSYYSRIHKGIEIEAEGDVEVVATMDGEVVEADSKVCNHVGNSDDYCCNNGMGNYVKIKHDNGLISEYLHLKYGSLTVEKGNYVKAGEVIGLMGNSGRSAKQHLYFQIGYSSTNTIDINPDKINYVYKKIDKSYENEKSTIWQVKPNVMLNLRSGTGIDYDVITSIAEEEKFVVTDIKNYKGQKWGRASFGEYTGWCSLEYAEEIPEYVKNEGTSVNEGQEENKSEESKNEESKNEESEDEEELCYLMYDTCGGEMDCDSRAYVKDSKITILDTPKKEGYVFLGWYTKKHGGKLVKEGYLVRNDVKLYAHWT